MDRMEVSLGLRGHEDDECLLTLHGLCSTPLALRQVETTVRETESEPEDVSPFAPEKVKDAKAVDVGQAAAPSASYSSFQNPLSMTPQPMSSFEHRNSPRSKHISPSPSMPLVFRISKADGEIWAKVIEEYKMFTPPLNILHYIGDVADHPQLPGIVFRKSVDGDQLWPDGTRYIGAWEEHTYHGQGKLMDPEGCL